MTIKTIIPPKVEDGELRQIIYEMFVGYLKDKELNQNNLDVFIDYATKFLQIELNETLLYILEQIKHDETTK